MSATVDYFENDEDETTDAFDWWKAMANNGPSSRPVGPKPTKFTTVAAMVHG